MHAGVGLFMRDGDAFNGEIGRKVLSKSKLIYLLARLKSFL